MAPTPPSILITDQSALMRFDPFWNELRESFSRAPLHAVAIALNRSCFAWDNGDVTPARLGYEGSALRSLQAGNPAWRWAASECFRQAVMWSPAYSFEGPIQPPKFTVGDVCSLTHRSVSAQLQVMPSDERALASSGVWDFLFPVWSPQFLMERSSALRPGQALWMFRDALRHREARIPTFPGRRLEEAITARLGMPVGQFVELLMLIYGRSVSSDPRLSAHLYSVTPSADEFGVVSTGPNGFFRTHVGAVIRTLAGDQDGMRSWMLDAAGSSLGASDLEMLRAPNPLLRFPLVRAFRSDPDFVTAPVPSCLLEWLYEPLADYLYEGLQADLRVPFALAFEEHVGMVLERHQPSNGQPWLHEEQLKPTTNTKVVDWARPFEHSVVLVDAKRCFIDPVMRYRLVAEDWASLEKALHRGVDQAAEFWRAVQQEEVPSLAGNRGKKPILLLVTQSDTSVIGSQERIQKNLAEAAAAKLPGLSVVLLCVDQLQHIAINWLERDDAWLEALLMRVATEGRGIISEAAPHQPRGPLWEAWATLHRVEEHAMPDAEQVTRAATRAR